MTNEMIERVAAAITKAFDAEARVFDDGQAEILARAAIEAMREPTVEMLVGAYVAAGIPESPLLANGYRAMIDAVIADPLPVFDRLTE